MRELWLVGVLDDPVAFEVASSLHHVAWTPRLVRIAVADRRYQLPGRVLKNEDHLMTLSILAHITGV